MNTMAEQIMHYENINDLPSYVLFLLGFMFKMMFFSAINLTLHVQNGSKMQFCSWRDLKQKREFILKDRNKAGNAIPTPALC